MIKIKWTLLILLTLFLPVNLAAQAVEDPGVYIIFDASGSMWGKLAGGKHKITAAREVLTDIFAQGFDNRPVALRAYGHRRKSDCTDTELIQDFSRVQLRIRQCSSSLASCWRW